MMLVTLLTATVMMTTATATSVVAGVSAAAFSSPYRPPSTTRKNNNLTALRLQHQRGDRGVERRITHGNHRSRRRNDSANNSVSRSSSKLSAAAAARSSIATSSAIIENSATVSNLAVALDRPLLSPVEFSYRNPSTGRTAAAWWISSFMSVLVSDIFKTACVAFIVAAGVSLLPRLIAARDTTTTTGTTRKNSMGEGEGRVGNVDYAHGTTAAAYSDDGENVMSIHDGEGGMSYTPAASSSSSSLQSTIRQLTKKATKIIDGLQQMAITTTSNAKKKNRKSSSSSSSSYSVPMPFNGDGNWNKCTLSSRIPGSSVDSQSTYSIYEFTLPETYYTLSLGLGQQLEFCCLGPNDEICTGSFYLYDGSCGCGTTASASTTLSLDGDDDERKKNMKTKSNKRGGGDTTTTTGVVRIVISNDKLADEGNSMFVSFSAIYIYLLVKHLPPSLPLGKAFFFAHTLSLIFISSFFSPLLSSLNKLYTHLHIYIYI